MAKLKKLNWFQRLFLEKRPKYAQDYLKWANDRIIRILADLELIEQDYKKKKRPKDLKFDRLYNQYLGKLSMLLYACQELRYPIKLTGYMRHKVLWYFSKNKKLK